MYADRMTRFIAIVEAFLVTIILGSTLVLVKLVLRDIGPLGITALRYSLAFVLLFPFLLVRKGFGKYSKRLWGRFILLGISFYVIGNGALYIGLKFIPATTGSLLLNFVPLLVMISGFFFLREIPTKVQLVGLAVAIIGSGIFFSPGLRPGEALGVLIVVIGLIGNATFDIIGREVQREGLTDTLTLTAIPLGVGSLVLLPAAFLLEGLPEAPGPSWLVIFLLAAINTAGVYALMNHALRVLAAFQMATMLILTPLLTALWAWILLDERLEVVQLLGMLVMVVGVLLVERGT
jgi:drug/metabolite transporter (DMT)-like permease